MPTPASPNPLASALAPIAHQRVERALFVLHDVGGGSLRIRLRHTLRLEDQSEFVLLGERRLFELLRFACDLCLRQLAGIGHGEPLAQCHRTCPRRQSGKTGQKHRGMRAAGAGDTHDQAEIGHQSIVGAQHRGPQAIAGCPPMPRLGARDVSARQPAACGFAHRRLQHRRVAALLCRDRAGIRLSCILVSVGEFGRGNGRQHESRAESLRELGEQPRAKTHDEAIILDARRLEFVAPQLSVFGFGLRQLQEQILAQRVSFGGREGGVQRRAIEFVAQVVSEAL